MRILGSIYETYEAPFCHYMGLKDIRLVGETMFQDNEQ
jgi:hypothetical protein